MYLKEIKIKNYKKLVDCYFQFGQLNVIVGKNNAGKTTLLELIKSFCDKDTKIIKSYLEDRPEGSEPLSIEIQTNEGLYYLDLSKAMPKWSKVGEFEENADFQYGYLSIDSKISEIEKTLEAGIAGYLLNGAEEEFSIIRNLLDGYPIIADLEHTSIIDEEGTDYSFNIDLNIGKALKLQFNNHINSIKKKGSGQQKEFVLRQFSEDEELSVDILLIDELENSLSMEAAKDIVNSLAREDEIDDNDSYLGVEEMQVFYTTHNQFTITKESNPNIIALGDTPPGILKNLNGSIFVEGPTDAAAFKQVFSDKVFIPGGGSNIVNVVKSVFDQGEIPKVIVDGDAPGLGYERAITAFLPSANICHLSCGTIEDYHSEPEVVGVININNSIGLTITTKSNNIIQDIVRPEYDAYALINTSKHHEIRIIKNNIQKCNLDVGKIHSELNGFISS